MRTRNKQAKDQPNSKRPKRGNETPDVSNEGPKTPSKSDKNRKPAKETPTKGKKRTNMDDDDGSDEKEKRKRTDVRVPHCFVIESDL